jgi:hypothetical protein
VVLSACHSIFSVGLGSFRSVHNYRAGEAMDIKKVLNDIAQQGDHKAKQDQYSGLIEKLISSQNKNDLQLFIEHCTYTPRL